MAIRLIPSLLAWLVLVEISSAQERQHQLLFESGRDGYRRYRIPSLIVTPGGTTLAICEGRKDGGGLTGNIDIVQRRSDDGGRTWSSLEFVADEGEQTLGNPCALVDSETKTVWLAFTCSHGGDTEEQIVAGTSRESTQVRIIKSTDDGKTWSRPVDITAEAKRPTWTWYGTGPGTGICLKNGRLVIPAYHAEKQTGIYRSHMIYSDDRGKSWKHGGAVGEHCGECHVVEKQNGELVLNARTNQGRERRTTAVSMDGGTTWSKATFDEALYDPHCEACLISLPTPADGQPLWLFGHPAGPGRRNLTVRLSRDEGRNWGTFRKLREGDSQYCSLAKLSNGEIGCLYDCWANGNYQLYYVRFTLDWLTGKE